MDKPFNLFFAPIERVSATSQIATKIPQTKIKNPFKQDMILSSLSFVPDALFRAKGTGLIKIGDNYITIKSTSLTDAVSVSIPLPPNGIEFKRDMNIELFIWNEVDGTIVSLTLMAGICGYLV